MGPRPPASASQTELIRRLDAEWRVLAGSRLMRSRLRSWAGVDERLTFDDGDQFVVAAQRRDAASWADRDKVLTALLERASNDALAKRVALRVMLPGTRRRVLQAAVRARSEPVVFVDDYSHLEPGEDPANGKPEAQQIDELVEWVRQRALVQDDAARLVVMTRVAGVTVDEVAVAQDVDPETLRQRRLRTERRLQQSLVLSR